MNALRPLAILDDPCGQPPVDQPQDPLVRDPVPEERPQPVPIKLAEEVADFTTCFDDLANAVRAWAKGWLPTEAAAELLIGHRGWLLREDFLQVAVEFEWDVYRDRQVAPVDFAAAADAVQGVLPCSDGERQVLLVAASIAEGIPVGR